MVPYEPESPSVPYLGAEIKRVNLVTQTVWLSGMYQIGERTIREYTRVFPIFFQITVVIVELDEFSRLISSLPAFCKQDS